MSKLKSLEELKQARQQAIEKALAATLATECSADGAGGHSDQVVLAVGMATCGIAAGAKTAMEALRDEVDKQGLKNVTVTSTGCIGLCYAEPIVEVRFPDGAVMRYGNVDDELAREIVKEHVAKGNLVQGPLFNDEEKLKHQVRIALRNCGVIDPTKLDDYLIRDGYQALGQALTGMSSDEVIRVVEDSGLRGRGGGGFPTGRKWRAASQSQGDRKYVICNADEGDPGAFMDRSILEGDPHSVLEAMAIAGYAIGADSGVIYIRAEYPLAVERLENAIGQAKERGLLGNDILGTGFNFNIVLSLGAGAFVCGEETALLRSVEGERGEPKSKPPFPAQRGLWDKPSIINNVETFANICPILLKGADWFRSIGTEKSPGTKVFALAGKINNVGLIEVPMGITLKEIIYDIGGGIRDDKKFKAVQTGGPSGGCIPSSMLDLKIDYDALQAIGSMMGSGGMIVMDEDDCMVGIAKFYLGFTVDESCGKCTPCRIGTTRMLEILNRITEGHGEPKDLEELNTLGNIIKDASLCGLGQTAPNPVLSTITHFRDEYEAHIYDKTCPSKRCVGILQYLIKPDKCIGCTVCARNCPVSCIKGEKKEVHVIDQDRCIKCGTCMEKCPTDAIVFE